MDDLAPHHTRPLGAEPQAPGHAAKRVAHGDLSPVPGAAAAPAGSVLESPGAMQHSLSRLVGAVRGASDSIGTVDRTIDRTTQRNAALVEQSAAAAGSPSEQAQRLADTVRVFKPAAA